MTQLAREAADVIRSRLKTVAPRLALVLGSGLGVLADQITDAQAIDYHDLPGFHAPKVAGHRGRLILGRLNDVPVACMQGRAHYYEGIDNNVIKTMVRTLRLLGCDTWLATNAAGSLRPQVTPGHLVVIKDHINLQFNNPLVGSNDDEFGPRFLGLEGLYDADMRHALMTIAANQQLPMTEGVYLGTLGPTFETPAEIHAFKTLGADVVGMSSIPEAIVARHCGMRVAVISAITNLAAGMHTANLSHEETLTGAELAAKHLLPLLHDFIADYARQLSDAKT